MAALRERAISLLSSTSGVNMQAGAGPTLLYTAPAGKLAYVTMVVVRAISATLAGGTSYAFTGWRSGVSLASMTSANSDYMVIRGADVTKYTRLSGGGTFSITNTTGSTGAATATIDVFGYLV